MTVTDERDPLAPRESTTSVSFDEKTVGAFPPITYRLQILSKAEVKEKRDMQTQEIKRWKDGNPQLQIVTKVKVLSGPVGVGETRGLWMDKTRKEGSLALALSEALADQGGSRPGNVVDVTYVRSDKPTTVGWSGRKIYEAKFIEFAPVESSEPDALAAGDDEPPF